ncbi:putative transmembrane protein, partial [Rhizoctonia solani 123E]
MRTIKADSKAAYFTYIGHWSSNTSDPGRRIWQTGGSMKLRIQGSALYLFGNLLPMGPGTSGSISTQYKASLSANSSYAGNAKAGDEKEFLICTIFYLDMNQPTNLTLSLASLGEGSSGLNLSRIEWTDPNLTNRTEQSISGSSASVDSNSWTLIEQDGSSCTTSNNTTMQLNFEVFVDNTLTLTPGDSDRWEAYASQNQTIDLYRNDNLANGNHTILFSDIQPGGQFCVLRADVSSLALSPTDAPSSTGMASPSGALPSSFPSKPLSGGGIAGVVIGILFAIGIIVGGALFVYRRRMGYGAIVRNVKKLRYCSKCGAAITGRYRMECVQA